MPVPIKLKNLRVTSLDVDFHEVSWEVSSTTEDVLDYSFQVLRSESPEGPFDILSSKFEDKYSFVDNIIQVLNNWRIYYYLIRVTEKVSGDTEDFGPVSQTPEPDIVAMELRRHIRILMREFAGRRCVVLPIRTFGQRCVDCWNENLQRRVKAGCLTCYDTSYARGYLHPIETFIQVDPSTKSNQHMNVGVTQQSNTTMRLGYYPPINPGDIIVEPENIRWRVNAQTQTEHSRASIQQIVEVHRVPSKDMEYAVPVRFDTALKNLFFTPARNYTNPHNLSNFEDEEIPGIFALYPSTYPRHK